MPTRNQHKPLKQPFPLRAKTKRKKGYIPKVWERRLQMQYVREKKKKKRHKNIGQMKKQGRNAQDQINKEEISKLPEK
jgi:hypothetical protein